MLAPVLLVVLMIGSICARLIPKKPNLRLVWGSTPILNNKYWSAAMNGAGYVSETFMNGFYGSINKREDWDRILDDEFKHMPRFLKKYAAFFTSLFLYDIYMISFDGYFIGGTPLEFMQSFLLRLARKKTVLLSYGSDSYVYRRIYSIELLNGLLTSYPESARRQDRVAKRVDYWCKNADVVVGGSMMFDGFGRWDVLIPSKVFIDTDSIKSIRKHSQADGYNGTVYIAHAPNHRGFKGTEFVINAIDRLKSDGLKVELLLLENMQNAEVLEILSTRADILVEQLLAPIHGLNALEGMASGLPTISNLSDARYAHTLRKLTYFCECPLVSATPEDIYDILKNLVVCPEKRESIGCKSREYVKRYHGMDSCEFLFRNVIKKALTGANIMNIYHPLLGTHPAIANRHFAGFRK